MITTFGEKQGRTCTARFRRSSYCSLNNSHIVHDSLKQKQLTNLFLIVKSKYINYSAASQSKIIKRMLLERALCIVQKQTQTKQMKQKLVILWLLRKIVSNHNSFTFLRPHLTQKHFKWHYYMHSCMIIYKKNEIKQLCWHNTSINLVRL